MSKRILFVIFILALALSCPACAAGDTDFTDVSGDAWYAEAVAYCREQGWMGGTSDTEFSPGSSMTRAMLATVLHRQAGSPAVTGTDSFTDTADDLWYSAAVLWASGEGVMGGYGNGLFGTDDPVTREQLAAILWRLEGSPAAEQGQTYADQDSIASYAIPAVAWAQEQNIMGGRDGNRFDPKGNATRAEVATVLMNRDKVSQTETAPAPTLPPGWEAKLEVVVGDAVFTATLADTQAAREFAGMLPMTVSLDDYGGFEKAGPLGRSLTASNSQITTVAGDIVLYNGSNIVMFYGSNSWSYTRLGKIDDLTGWADALGSGGVSVTFRLAGSRQEQPQTAAPVFDFETRTVKLNSGYVMPINGLGTYSLTGETCVNSVKAALSSGVRLIDTAYMYGNEAEVGRAIRESGVPREEIFVITKLYPGAQYSNPEQAIQDALDKLDIGYIDMMLLHHPGNNDVAAYKAMERAVAEGTIHSIGLSNWYVKELGDFLPQVDTVPALVQNEIHPYYQENDVIPFIQNLGIVTQGWYPLGGRGYTAELLGDKTITAIADAHGVSAAQVILRWNLQKGVVVIPGSSNPDHILENTQLYDFELSGEEMVQINALDRGEKHDWY